MARLSDPTKRVKKSSFNMINFLCKHHDASNIYDIKIEGNNNWADVLRKSDVITKEGLLLFLDRSNTVIYIGHSLNLYGYITHLKRNVPMEETSRVILVSNENPSKLIHATNAYKAKFSPKYNSTRGGRFIFDGDQTTINISPVNARLIDWIKNNPTSTRRQFVDTFKDYNNGHINNLLRLYSVKGFSYKDLKSAIINN